MAGTFDWGVQLILWLQRMSPALDWPFRALTSLGEEEFLLILLPLCYWCLSRSTGARLALLFLFSSYFNSWAKVLISLPRPYQFDPRVRQLFAVTGFAFPSGHTQGTVVIWGYLASAFHRRWLWIVALALMLLVPLSRLYLGLHFPIDLLGGYVIGAVLLVLFLWLAPKVEPWLAGRAWPWQLAPAIIIPLALLILFPTADTAGVTSAAMLMGMSLGLIVERRIFAFQSGGLWQKQVLRFLLGFIVLVALRYGLKAAFAGFQSVLVFQFIRYVLMDLWAALGAPWTFVRLKLAAGDRPQPRLEARPA